MCFDDADWKREEIPDHKFDYVDIEDFVDESLMRKLSYMTVFFLTLQSILVYVADLGAVILLIATNGFDNVLSGNGNTTTDASTLNIKRTFQIDSKIKIILIVASVFVSFVLLFIEWYKARAIIRSRDISYAFTSKTAYRFYAIRSYAYYCFFYQIQNSRKTTDLVAFFVYFRFKNWKRLVFAEAPRQILNVFFLIDVTKAVYIRYPKTSILTFFGNLLTGLQPEAVVGKSQDLVTFLNFMVLLFTFTIWGVGMLALIGAFFVYIPLLFTIRGNLKEYCVHKIDKRIGELIKRKSKRRQQEARQQEREEQELGILNINRPTLPDVHVDLTRKSSGNTQYNYVFKSRTPQMGYAGSQPGYAGSQPGHADSEIDSYYGTNHMYPNRAESEYSSDYAGDGNSEYTSASHLARVRQYHPNPTTQMNPTQLPHRDASRWGNPNVN